MVMISITDLRTQIRKLADRVMFQGERIVIERNGEPVFVMVSPEDAALLEAIEDKIDLQAAKAAIKDKHTIKLDELVKKLKH